MEDPIVGIGLLLQKLFPDCLDQILVVIHLNNPGSGKLVEPILVCVARHFPTRPGIYYVDSAKIARQVGTAT
jgi:hypothetical protein